MISYDFCSSGREAFGYRPLKAHHRIPLRESFDLELVYSFEALEEVITILLSVDVLEDCMKVNNQTYFGSGHVYGKPSASLLRAVETESSKCDRRDLFVCSQVLNLVRHLAHSRLLEIGVETDAVSFRRVHYVSRRKLCVHSRGDCASCLGQMGHS
jgi:hypothetical protein